MRAVQSSDFAIGEFKILRRLLLLHGRTNNIRICEMILYFFYKNFVFTLTHFFYAFYNNCSGQTVIDDWFISLFNMIFTAFPLGIGAILELDVKPSDGKIIYQLMPFLYKENRDNPIFTKTSFILGLIRGTVQCIINYFFIIFTLGYASVNSEGDFPDLWFISVNLFTNIIMVNK
jgi:magnesium-transporting ATPase (P-type)